jgi:hypothetical protein
MLKGTCHCGRTSWELEGEIASATACNCTLCRRYGVLWAYGYENDGVRASGELASYVRPGSAEPSLEILFCPTCANVVSWRGLRLGRKGKRRMAVNLRLTEPEAISTLPIDHFDGLNTFSDLPRDGRCISDMWF